MLSFSKFAILLGLLALCFLATITAKAVVRGLSLGKVVNGKEVRNRVKGAASMTTASVLSMTVIFVAILSCKSFQPDSILILRYQNLFANYYLPTFAAKAVVEGSRGMLQLLYHLGEHILEEQGV
jgi:hypothetical protein